MSEKRKQTDVMVIPVDLTPHLDMSDMEWWDKSRPGKPRPTSLHINDDWGYVLLPDGRIYVLCAEGVDLVPAYDGKYVFDIHAEWVKATPEPAYGGTSRADSPRRLRRAHVRRSEGTAVR